MRNREAWSPAFYGDDLTCDVRDNYKHFLRMKYTPEQAIEKLVKDFQPEEAEGIPLKDRGQIEIVRQNFGFDLEQGVNTVELDADTEPYYPEVKRLKQTTVQ